MQCRTFKDRCSAGADPARPREEPLKVTVKRRLEQESRWTGKIELERDHMMKLARKQVMT